MIQLSGVYVPVITPFEKGSQAVGYDMLQDNISKLNNTDVAGYMPLGSNGESCMLTDDEAADIVKRVKEAAAPGKQVYAGAGRESTKGTLDLIERLAALGIDAVFVLPPHFFPKQMTQQALSDYYREIADRSPLPVILYNAPGYAGGVSIQPETAAELALHPNIIGMKDSSSAPVPDFLSRLPEGVRFSVLAGTMEKFPASMSQGATGGVLSASNYMPNICCGLYHHIMDGNAERAEALHDAICELAKTTTAPHGVPGVKCAMNLLGFAGGVPRSPLVPADENVMRGPLLSGIHELITGGI